MHADYAATFLSALPCCSWRLVASGRQGGAFPGHGPGGPKNRPPHAATYTGQGLRHISEGTQRVTSGVGGKVGPDAAGEKSLQRGDFSVAVNLAWNSRSERATKAAKCGSFTCKAAPTSATVENGCGLSSPHGWALKAQPTWPPSFTKNNCDDFKIFASVFRAGSHIYCVSSNYELNLVFSDYDKMTLWISTIWGNW